MSALYEGTIRHRRFAVRRREFRHRIALAYVDLEAPAPALRRGLVRFCAEDFLSADEARRRAVTSGPVRVLAHLRTLGHVFNPVAFYFCFDEDEQVQAVIAEVTNTPWGERHTYVLPTGGELTDKALHVSPFQAMDQAYRWRASAPGETLAVHIESRRDDERIFDATLNLRRRPLRRRRVALSALRVLPLIYGHALALWLRRVPVHPHPAAR